MGWDRRFLIAVARAWMWLGSRAIFRKVWIIIATGYLVATGIDAAIVVS
jgi:hypothetical protein